MIRYLRHHRWLMLILVIFLTLPTAIHFQAASHPAEAATYTYTANPNTPIPDSPGSCTPIVPGTAVTSTITVPDGYPVADVNVQLNITHTFVGDLMATLTHGATTITLFEQPGGNCGPFSGNNIITTLDDESAGGPVQTANPPTGPSYTPLQALSAFDGQNANGAWTLNVYDLQGADTGTFVSWGLVIEDTVVPLAANGACNLNNLNVNITAGDGPFNITGTGPGLPLNSVSAGTYPLTGPGAWTGVTVTETTDDLETTNLGNFNCATVALAASAVCNANNLDVTITAGDTPFNITGTGPGLPLNGVSVGTYPLTGPGPWTGVTVTEVGGNGQSTNLGTFNCATDGLTVSASCLGNNLVIALTAGDAPFNITGTGPGLPINGATWANIPLFGPGTWAGVTITETAGNLESTNLGNFDCTTNGLTAAAACNAQDLVVTITAGDGPFNIVGTGPGLPRMNVAVGAHTFLGAGQWTAVDVVETTGNLQVISLGNISCVTILPTPPPVIPGIPVPNLGLIKIDLGQAQFALQSPNGQPIALSNGTPVLLPADADHNGFDTYTVTGIYWTGGDYWLSIFLGNTTWGWVALDDVTPLTPLDLPEPVTSISNTKE